MDNEAYHLGAYSNIFNLALIASQIAFGIIGSLGRTPSRWNSLTPTLFSQAYQFPDTKNTRVEIWNCEHSLGWPDCNTVEYYSQRRLFSSSEFTLH